MYRPRVQAVMAGQTLQIKNSDQTLHNVHSYKGASTLFNQAEIPGHAAHRPSKLTEADEILKFKCDVHPWMTGYVVGVEQPVLRGHRRRRQLQDHGRAARQLHARGLARAVRRPRPPRSRWPRTSRPRSRFKYESR